MGVDVITFEDDAKNPALKLNRRMRMVELVEPYCHGNLSLPYPNSLDVRVPRYMKSFMVA